MTGELYCTKRGSRVLGGPKGVMASGRIWYLKEMGVGTSEHFS